MLRHDLTELRKVPSQSQVGEENPRGATNDSTREGRDGHSAESFPVK